MKKHDYNRQIAENYDADRQSEEHWAKENEFIIEYFKKRSADALLDLPVGTGRFLKFYPLINRIIGADISNDMLDQAKILIYKNDLKNIELIECAAAELHFLENKSVDFIVCFRLLHLIDHGERVKIFKEFSRVLRGKLLLQVYQNRPKASVFSRILRQLRRGTKSELFVRAEKKPWSHIKSFGLSKDELLRLLQFSKLTIV